MKTNFLCVVLLLAGQWLALAADESLAKRQTVRVRADDGALLLAQGWAEAFGSSHPTQWADISGGNGSPVLALTRDTNVLGLMARPISPAELKKCVETFGEPPRESTVAFAAMAIYAQLDNPVSAVTLTQLQDIYSGRISNWQAVGGRNAPIQVYARQPHQGYHDYFLRIVTKTNLPLPGAVTVLGSQQMLEFLAKDPNGIGYAPRQAALSVKYLALQDTEKSLAVIPSSKTVPQGRYPIVQPIKAYLAPKCDNAAALSFFAWLSLDTAQKYAEENGFFRARVAQRDESPVSK